jgi:hypothetical protein
VLRRTLEAIFRYPLQLLVLLVILPVFGVGLEYYKVPRTYESSASVWALQRYFVVGATGPESDLTSTPAETQSIALNELLQTRAFSLAVVKGINLGPSLGLSESVMNNPRQLEDAEYSDISAHVVASPSAYNLYNITYSNRDPKIAQQVVISVIANFGLQSLGLSVAEGQNLLSSYKTQLASAQKDLNNAVTIETKYVVNHPNVKLASDPQYALLDTERVQALANVQSIQNIINSIQQSIINAQGTGTSTLFQVIDEPLIPDRPLSRTKDFLLGGGAGLGIALLSYLIFLIILVRRDRGIYSAVDLQNVAQYQVVMQLPKLTPRTISLLTTSSTRGPGLPEVSQNGVNGHLARS